VEALKVKHIIVCGHYGCGGVLAALREWLGLPLENWLAYVRAVRQTEVVKVAWRQDRPVVVHGWIYDLREGLLRDLDLN
jgi:carbonic anhydrase